MIKIVAPLDCVPFPRPMQNGKRRYNPKKYTDFKNALGLFARRQMHGQPPLSEALKISITVFRNAVPISLIFGDWDNLAKSVCDALNGICYCDDRQIVKATVELCKGDPLIVIELEAT